MWSRELHDTHRADAAEGTQGLTGMRIAGGSLRVVEGLVCVGRWWIRVA
jgi:hypothetical protein